MPNSATQWVAFGRIKGAVGLRGDVRVIPYSLAITRLLPDPAPMMTFPLNILMEFSRWRLSRNQPAADSLAKAAFFEVEWSTGRLKGDQIQVQFDGIENREEIQKLAGLQIWLPITALPVLPKYHYYWFQLTGLRVIEMGDAEREPKDLGLVEAVLATGANDVLSLRESGGGERLLPFIHDTIVEVDLDGGKLFVRLMPGL